jgi:hypothetical protein
MNTSMTNFVFKVFAISALVGALIKYAVPVLAPSPSLGLCLLLLLAPAGFMAALFWRQAG